MLGVTSFYRSSSIFHKSASAVLIATSSITFLGSLTGLCQGVFDTGREVFSDQGEDRTSKPFTMNGPFVLSWTLIDKPPAKAADRKYHKPYNQANPAWLSIRVFDAQTMKRVEWESKSAMTGNLAIPKGGSFYLTVTSYDGVAWTIRAKEGKLVMTDQGETIVPTTSADRDRAAGNSTITRVPATYSAAPARTYRPEEVPEPKPSSIPGAPAGMEKAKVPELPPGMKKR